MYITFLGTNIDVRSVIFDTPSDVASHWWIHSYLHTYIHR
jgi:hypothetical protein